MANITKEKIGTLHEKLTLTLEKNDYMPVVEKAIKDFAKKANIQGFRKGMVPAGMIRKMYGQALLADEVARIVNKEMDEYLKKANVAIFAQPLMMLREEKSQMDIYNPADLDFDFEIGIKPLLEIEPVIKSANIKKYNINVTDEILERELATLKSRYGTHVDKDAVSSVEEIIECTFKKSDETGMVTDGDEGTSVKKPLNSFPGKIQELLLGKVVGDKINFKPIDVCKEEELAGFLKDTLKTDASNSEHIYELSVTGIKVLVSAEMGDEFYKKVYGETEIKDETEFRSKLRVDLVIDYGNAAHQRLQNEIFEYLVHNTPIVLPVNFLKRWLAEGGEKQQTPEEVEKRFPSFEHSLRWQLITEQIVAANNLFVSQEDVDNELKSKAMSYLGISDESQAPWISGYLERMKKDEKMQDETYQRLLTERLFNYLETQFSFVETEIEEKDFLALNNEHEAHHHH